MRRVLGATRMGLRFAAGVVAGLLLVQTVAAQTVLQTIQTDIDVGGIVVNPGANRVYLAGVLFTGARVLGIVNGVDNSLSIVPTGLYPFLMRPGPGARPLAVAPTRDRLFLLGRNQFGEFRLASFDGNG